MPVSKLLGISATFGKEAKLSGELTRRFQNLQSWINHYAADHTHTGGNDGSKLAVSSAYTITNVTPDRAYDANSVLIAEIADVLGTLIDDLKTAGIIT